MNLQLDENGSVVISNGQIQVVSGGEEVRQRLFVRLHTGRGEWPLDITEFIDWSRILVKAPQYGVIEALFKAEILETRGVVRLERFEFSPTEDERGIRLDFTALAEDGSTVEARLFAADDPDTPNGLAMLLAAHVL